ncbi:hypothetical protein BGZ72_002143, partial [Mortierella alpina]
MRPRLGQGGVECRLLWRISYKVLLAEVMNVGVGFSFMREAALREHHHLPALVPAVDDTDVQVSRLVFVDDTHWTVPSRENLQAIADIAMEFCGINQTEVNPKNSELVVINQQTTYLHMTLKLAAIESSCNTRPWPSDLGRMGVSRRRNQDHLAMVKREVTAFCAILARKAVTDKQAIYLVNSVFIPWPMYRLTPIILTAQAITPNVLKYRSGIRQKLGTPNSILHHLRICGLREFGDVQEEEPVPTVRLRFQDKGLVGQ